ncbi:MAG: hypothetical protein R3B41_00895 [Candidatus Doudnabacteria bacterium]
MQNLIFSIIALCLGAVSWVTYQTSATASKLMFAAAIVIAINPVCTALAFFLRPYQQYVRRKQVDKIVACVVNMDDGEVYANSLDQDMVREIAYELKGYPVAVEISGASLVVTKLAV